MNDMYCIVALITTYCNKHVSEKLNIINFIKLISKLWLSFSIEL